MKKYTILLLILTFCFLQGVAQKKRFWYTSESKTLLLEKIGTRHRFSFEPGDMIKLRTKNKLMMYSYLWELNDSSISVGQCKPFPLQNVESVYPQFLFARKFGKYMFLSGIVYFAIVSFDHLINSEIVVSKDVFMVPAALFGAGLISISLSEKRCKIGDRWKLKVLGIRIQ